MTTQKQKPKPRIITKTVRRLRRMAKTLDAIFPASRDENAIVGAAAEELRSIATELDASDARETRPDPSKRRRRSADHK